MGVDPLVIIVVVLGVAVSFATSLFKQFEWSARLKHTVATALSVAVGGVVAWQAGDFNDLTDVAAVITGVYATSQLFYGLILRSTATDAALERVGGPVNLDDEVDHVETVVEVPVPAPKEDEEVVVTDDRPEV